MKTTRTSRWLAAAACTAVFTLAACNEKQLDTEIPAPSNGRYIILSAGAAAFEGDTGGATRASSGTGHGDSGATLRSGEQIGVEFLSGSTEQYATYEIKGGTAGGYATATAVTGGNESLQPLFSIDSTEVKVRAYFPATAASRPVSFTVAADQQVDDAALMDDGYTMSDLMYAPAATVDAYGTGQPLRFEHRMARLCVAMNTGGTDVTELAVVGGTFRTVNIADPETLTLGTALGTPCSETEPIVIWKGTDNQGGAAPYTWYASCLVPPQVLATTDESGAEPAVLRIGFADGTYTRLTMQPKTVAGGHSYCVRLTLCEQLKGQTVSLGNWEPYSTVTLNTSDPNLYPGEGREYTVGGVTFRMRQVTGDGHDFMLAESEVTQQLWLAAGMPLPAIGTAADQGDRHPVANVSYNGTKGPNAADFIDRINEATRQQRPEGWVFTLPTRDQWTYAYHGGLYHSTLTFAGSQNLSDVAWHNMFATAGTAEPGQNAEGHTHDVMTLLPNELGLYDMAGNVCEMVLPVADGRIGFMGGSARDIAKSSFLPSQTNAIDAGTPSADMGLRLALVYVGTLAQVKQAVDARNTGVMHDVMGWYVAPDGTISPSDATATAIGRIAYIDHDQQDADEHYAGSRMLVLATQLVPATGKKGTDYYEDAAGNAMFRYINNHVSNQSIDSRYLSEEARNGYDWTYAHREASDRPAACAAWQYNTLQPLSGINSVLSWFVPSYRQWRDMAAAIGTLQPDGYYLSATTNQRNRQHAFYYNSRGGNMTSQMASSTGYLRLCFAY